MRIVDTKGVARNVRAVAFGHLSLESAAAERLRHHRRNRRRHVAAREALLDRAMGPGRKRKSSEKLRRGRRPSEGLAFVARDADGRVVGTVRLWDVAVGDAARRPSARAARRRSVAEERRHRLGADAPCDRRGRASRPSRDPAGRRCALLRGASASRPKRPGRWPCPGPMSGTGCWRWSWGGRARRRTGRAQSRGAPAAPPADAACSGAGRCIERFSRNCAERP